MKYVILVLTLGLTACNPTTSLNSSTPTTSTQTTPVTTVSTPAPTSSPTSSPTANPTASPTSDPSASPSPVYVTSVSGTAFTCGYTSGNVAYCSGDNTYGQLADNFAEISSENAIQVDTGTTRLSAYGNYVCETKGNNIVKCWGNNQGVPAQIYSDSFNRLNRLQVGNNIACFSGNTGTPYTAYLQCWTEANGGDLTTMNLNAMISYTTDYAYVDNLYVDTSGNMCVGIALYNPSTSQYVTGDTVVCGSQLSNYKLVN